MRSARIRQAKCVFATSLALLATSCRIDFSGLNMLLDSAPSYLNLPGRRVAAGHFERVSVDGTDANGAYVIAFDAETDQPKLAITPFGGGKTCRTGRATSYRTFQLGTRSTLTPFVPYLEPVSGSSSRRLHLTSHTCEEPLPAIDSNNLPLAPPFDDSLRYLTLTGNGDLLLLKPWDKKQDSIAEDTSSVVFSGDKMWAIEGGALVVRSSTYEELGRFGTDVQEFEVSDQSPNRIAYVDGEDERVLRFVIDDDDKLEETSALDRDVCKVHFPTGFRGKGSLYGVSYLSPCDSRNLVVYGDAGVSSGDVVKYVLGDHAGGIANVQFAGRVPYVFFTRNTDEAPDTYTLVGGRLGALTSAIAADPKVDSRGAPVMSQISKGVWEVVVDVVADANKNKVGRLIRYVPSEKTPFEIARGVEETQGDFAIANFDGETKTGDLILIGASGSTRTLEHGVPVGGVLVGDSGVAVLTEFANGHGMLKLSGPDSIAFETVSANVRSGAFSFLRSLNALAYTYDFDPASKTSILAVRVVDTGDTFDGGIRMSEWREVPWPEPGLLYVIPHGDRTGIWFAKLK